MLCNTNSRQESLIHIKRMSCEMSNNTQRIILENDVVPTEYKRMPNSNPLLMKKKLKKTIIAFLQDLAYLQLLLI